MTAAASLLLVTGAAIGAGGTAAAAGAPAATSAGSERVIVVMRTQFGTMPSSRSAIADRTARAVSSQNAVLNQLAGAKVSHVAHFSLANAFSANVTTSQAQALAANPAVASVVKDSSIPLMPATMSTPAAHASVGKARANADTIDPFQVCPTDPAQPLVEPEALNSIHALSSDGSPDAQSLTKGAGVTVAYIADGIDPDNPDFIRPNGDHVIVDYQDFSGDGPNAPSGGGEAFGDASSIAAQGIVSHDLSNFVNQAHPLPPGCNIRIVGVAPDASIVALKAGGEFLTNSSILQSIDYAVRVDHVDVINESFGLSEFPDDSSRNTVELFNDAAVAAGVTITESTGDGGVTGTIGSDAQDPKVISVGATTNFRLYAQTTYAAEPFSNGHWANDNISALSSSGFTQLGRTVDLVAPGEAGWAACEPGFASCVNFRSPAGPSDIEAFGGTSQSAPFTAGVAALVISAYRSSHGGDSPTPAVVKQIITGTAHDLGLPPFEQGSGLLNARAAVEAALTWPGATTDPPASVKSNIVTSPNQVTLQGKPGSTKSKSFDVTNVGNHSVHVSAGSRSFRTTAESAQATAFDSTTLPTFTYYNGQSWAFKVLHFNVP
ncbi:MAG TPA: S8 family serine peptidase, partial [Acidimicrobiales bacterium]